MEFAKLSLSERIERCRAFSAPYRLTDGKKFCLKEIDPDDTGELTSEDKPQAKEALAVGVELLAELQERLYAQDCWAVLLIFQAMDAAGKDSCIKHVMLRGARTRRRRADGRNVPIAKPAALD
jgi:polyphosphate kinase 2 (PPK2 family)